jgi:hypothetical protein
MLTHFVLWINAVSMIGNMLQQHNIKSSGVLNKYIYFVSEINKLTNNV